MRASQSLDDKQIKKAKLEGLIFYRRNKIILIIIYTIINTLMLIGIIKLLEKGGEQKALAIGLMLAVLIFLTLKVTIGMNTNKIHKRICELKSLK